MQSLLLYWCYIVVILLLSSQVEVLNSLSNSKALTHLTPVPQPGATGDELGPVPGLEPWPRGTLHYDTDCLESLEDVHTCDIFLTYVTCVCGTLWNLCGD